MLTELSLFWCFCHVYIPFLMLYELRGKRRYAITASVLFIGVLTALNVVLMMHGGASAIASYFVITRSVPAFVFFYFLVKDRSGRYLFTFCLVDTVTLWIILFSGLVDRLLGSDSVFLLVFRLLIMPILEYVTWRYLRKPYRKLLHSIDHGFGILAVIAALIYVLFAAMPPLAFIGTQPWKPLAVTIILILVLIPLTYILIFFMLHQQNIAHLERERQGFLQAQISMMERRIEETAQAEKKLRIERHDLRHRLNTVATLVENEERAEALNYLSTAKAALEQTAPRKYCHNVILDAIFSFYFEKAQLAGIAVEHKLVIPNELPVDAAELSTVFANALENAIHACEKLPMEQRKIICTCITDSGFMFEVSNPCREKVSFGSNGLPLTEDGSPGIGTLSIMAFAEKHDAICRFCYDDGWFRIQVVL